MAKFTARQLAVLMVGSRLLCLARVSYPRHLLLNKLQRRKKMAFFKTAIIDCVAKLLGITVWINNVCYGAKPKSFSDVDVCKN